MCTPYPRTGSTEQGDQDSHLPMELGEQHNTRVRARIQQECGDSIPISIQGRHEWGQKVGVGGKHVQKVCQGRSEVGLESLALPRQEVGNVPW